MPSVAEIAALLEQLAPPDLAEDYDNVGILLGEAEREVRGVLLCLDITPEVLEEAVARSCNLVVSHHPIWFRSRKHLRGDDFVSTQLLYAVRNDLTIYACHTNLDNIRAGVNRTIVDRLGLRDVRILAPREGDANTGSGMIGELPEPGSVPDFLKTLKNVFGCEGIRYSMTENKKIRRVAVCGGAGSFLLEHALDQGADAFVTSDVTYHHFFEPQGRLLFVDIGHYESEQFTPEVLRGALEGVSVPVLISRVNTNPVRYFRET